jgi:hypothetical protein
MILRFLILFALMISALPVQAQDMSVEQAYALIYEDRIPFDGKQSTLDEKDTKYLEHLFFVTDMAMRLRVVMLNNFRKGNISGLKYYEGEITSLLSSFEMVETPELLIPVQKDVVEAINDQKMFFKSWAKLAGTPEFLTIMKTMTNEPLVFSSHQKLIRAYKGLIDAYPGESGYNQKAFYAHLCALDFI